MNSSSFNYDFPGAAGIAEPQGDFSQNPLAEIEAAESMLNDAVRQLSGGNSPFYPPEYPPTGNGEPAYSPYGSQPYPGQSPYGEQGPGSWGGNCPPIGNGQPFYSPYGNQPYPGQSPYGEQGPGPSFWGGSYPPIGNGEPPYSPYGSQPCPGQSPYGEQGPGSWGGNCPPIGNGQPFYSPYGNQPYPGQSPYGEQGPGSWGGNCPPIGSGAQPDPSIGSGAQPDPSIGGGAQPYPPDPGSNYRMNPATEQWAIGQLLAHMSEIGSDAGFSIEQLEGYADGPLTGESWEDAPRYAARMLLQDSVALNALDVANGVGQHDGYYGSADLEKRYEYLSNP